MTATPCGRGGGGGIVGSIRTPMGFPEAGKGVREGHRGPGLPIPPEPFGCPQDGELTPSLGNCYLWGTTSKQDFPR